MAHHHHDDDTYFLDQICMVALSGAFGVICLCLYFVQQGMLFRLLAPQFHLFVLMSGVVLLLIAVVLAGLLWSMASDQAQTDAGHDDCCAAPTVSHEDCGHDHGHSHSHADHGHSHSHEDSHSHSAPAHSHSHGDHDHAHSHAAIAESRAFGHTPAASHSHAQAHSHGEGSDHDHGWAPWRYVLLLIPIIFFMLGIPNKGPSFDVDGTKIIEHDTTEDAVHGAALVTFAVNPWEALGPMFARQTADALSTDVEYVDVKRLEAMAANAADRDFYKGKAIRVRGQFIPRNDRYFEVGRFKIQCCAGDAIPIRIPVMAKESISGLKAQDWVELIGKLDFRESGGEMKTIIIVAKRSQVKSCPPDLNPYVQ